MRIALVMLFYSDRDVSAEHVLGAYPLERELPVALARFGHDVAVFHHAGFDASVAREGAAWRFIRPAAVTRLGGRLLFRWKGSFGPAYYQPAIGLALELRAWQPEVVHFFGLTIDLQLALISRVCAGAGIPLVVHYHGGPPAPGRIGHVQRHNLRRVARALFTAREQARPWIEARMLRGWEQVDEVLETTSPFHGIARDAARAVTGMRGDPVYLSAGRLHPIKDPLTMLRGFARITEAQPAARLYVYYLTDELLPEINDALARAPQLRERVELRGRAPASAMEAIYSSADFLLQASLREWSGLAVLEAMSCGCIPIVTGIPSFAVITGDGRFGRLFEPGDAAGLAAAALSVPAAERGQLARAVAEHFERNLSFDALARQLDAIYRDLTARSAKNKGARRGER